MIPESFLLFTPCSLACGVIAPFKTGGGDHVTTGRLRWGLYSSFPLPGASSIFLPRGVEKQTSARDTSKTRTWAHRARRRVRRVSARNSCAHPRFPSYGAAAVMHRNANDPSKRTPFRPRASAAGPSRPGRRVGPRTRPFGLRKEYSRRAPRGAPDSAKAPFSKPWRKRCRPRLRGD